MLALVGLFLWCAGLSLADDFEHVPMENPDLFGGDMAGIDYNEDRTAISKEARLWPDGIVPYVLDPGLIEAIKNSSLIDRVMRDYEKKTCIRFVPRTDEKDYIRLQRLKGCYSYVGRSGGPQILSLGRGCMWQGTIAHELGHAIGFYHEQNRSDRDKYLTIFWKNIKDGQQHQFMKLAPFQTINLTPFDYNSIMLYGSLSFSVNKAKKLRTMEGKDGRFLKEVITKRLSQNDVKRINKLYKCKM